MLFKGDAKLVLPFCREYGSPACLWFGSFFDDPLINLRGSEVKYKKVLIIRADELAKNLVSVTRIPVHHVKQLHEEKPSGYLTRLSLAAAAGAPLK